MYGPGISIFTREAVVDTKLKGVPIAAGTLLNPEFMPNNYNEAYFEDPNSFRPERWLEDRPLAHPYAYTPFSSGSRNCIGQHFSNMMEKTVLIKLLRRYTVEIAHPESIKLLWRFFMTPDHFEAQVAKKGTDARPDR